ncbi:MAG: hybrid sensor histidine kinase/response regulator, partial [Phototrophicales bacterium]
HEIFDKVQAFEVGGLDYITKPFQFEEVIARVQTHLTIIRQQERLRWQAEQLEKMAERDRQRYEKITAIREKFVRGAAHDLKNPLTLVGGYAAMMLNMNQIRQDP